jgi:hypothetical protein
MKSTIEHAGSRKLMGQNFGLLEPQFAQSNLRLGSSSAPTCRTNFSSCAAFTRLARDHHCGSAQTISTHAHIFSKTEEAEN